MSYENIDLRTIAINYIYILIVICSELQLCSDGFSTDIFRKKTFTGLYFDFTSLTPCVCKVNMVRSLVSRAFNICFSYFSFHNELTHIQRILKVNRFSMSLINKVIKSFLENIFSPTDKDRSIKDNKFPLFLYSFPRP